MIESFIVLLPLVLFLFLGIQEGGMNPLVVFNGVWLSCILLSFTNLSPYYIVQLSQKSVTVIVTMVVSFNMFFLFSNRHRTKLNHIIIPKSNTYFKYDAIFSIWAALIIAEIIYCRGLPILWSITGQQRNYAEFGIPSLHGFVNSLSWYIATKSFIDYLNSKNTRQLYKLVTINLVYILLFARQSIVTEVIQLVTIYIFKRKPKLRKLVIFLILFLLLFGIIGNYRTGNDHILHTSGVLLKDGSSISANLLWTYLYMVTPLANIVNNINLSSFHTYGGLALASLLPTVVLRTLNIDVYGIEHYLVRETYNVMTSIYIPYTDFGILGVFAYFAFLGFMGGRIWNSAKSSMSDKALMYYAIYIGIVALTFFSDMLFKLPVLMQFLYVYIFISKSENSKAENNNVQSKCRYIASNL